MSDNEALSILLVEDSPTVVAMVEYWLEDGLTMPLQLRVAATMAEGLAVLADHRVDLVILDLNLPDNEGLDTFAKVHAQADRIPIIIMSSESDEQVALSAVHRGAEDYIVKRGFGDENPLRRPVQFAIERARHKKTQQELHRAQLQLDLAYTFQQEMLPMHSPRIPGFDVSGRCIPAEKVAGDYFDFFPVADDKWGVLIGDVCGHGLGPALQMMATRGALRALMKSFGNTGTITTRTNRVLQYDSQRGRFVTLFLLILDPGQNTIQYSSAGHPGALFDSKGNLKEALKSYQPPLGIVEDLTYTTQETHLNPGDVLVLVTDGITEAKATDQRLFGQERLFDVVRRNLSRSAAAIVDELFQEVQTFTGSEIPEDDLTVVILKRLPE